MLDSNATPTGQVENYLQDVLNCQRKTLGNTLKRSLKRYPNQARVEWLMDADPPGSISKTDPAQVKHRLAKATQPFAWHIVWLLGSLVREHCCLAARAFDRAMKYRCLSNALFCPPPGCSSCGGYQLRFGGRSYLGQGGHGRQLCPDGVPRSSSERMLTQV